ncbi:hypothetical protein ABES38_08770 [Bacillus gobiensis]|uniref:hypothetical protein n=1 Tax=Bacillus gobiensis TaxID=1441095 RepID=UPI003D1E74E4
MCIQHEKPTYRRIELRLPTPPPPGVPPLPPVIYFDVDTRFTTSQTNRIRLVILIVISTWQQHFIEKEASPYLSQLAMCTQKYAIRNLTPLWSRGPAITSGTEAANLAMNTLTQRFIENGTGKVDVATIDYRIPAPGERSTIRAKTAKRQFKVPLSVTINPQVLDDQTIANLDLAGSLLHAWYHRCGFYHPEDIYTTYFIGEAPMCVMRGYQDKNPNVPDTLLTQFFD